MEVAPGAVPDPVVGPDGPAADVLWPGCVDEGPSTGVIS